MTMDERLAVSVIIVARDEADRIARALASVSWAEEVVVVDSGSRDGTPEIARRAGARVILHAWEGYGAQKAFAVAQATHPWILWIDADEEVTPRLRASVEAALARQARGGERASAYRANRRTEYLGRYLRFGGWYPDSKVRLFRRDRAEFDGRQVHEGLRVRGAVGRLTGDLLHHSYRDFEHHVAKTHELARLWAAERRGRRVRAWELLLHPAAKALKSYLWQGGLLEGWRGLLLAGMGGYYVWLKYALLRAQAPADAPDGTGGGGGASARRAAPEGHAREEDADG